MLTLLQQTYTKSYTMLSENEYAPYYKAYIEPVVANGKTIVDNLKDSQTAFEEFLRKQPKAKHDYSYAKGK